jgi:hypothetical protein
MYLCGRSVPRDIPMVSKTAKVNVTASASVRSLVLDRVFWGTSGAYGVE